MCENKIIRSKGFTGIEFTVGIDLIVDNKFENIPITYNNEAIGVVTDSIKINEDIIALKGLLFFHVLPDFLIEEKFNTSVEYSITNIYSGDDYAVKQTIYATSIAILELGNIKH